MIKWRRIYQSSFKSDSDKMTEDLFKSIMSEVKNDVFLLREREGFQGTPITMHN